MSSHTSSDQPQEKIVMVSEDFQKALENKEPIKCKELEIVNSGIHKETKVILPHDFEIDKLTIHDMDYIELNGKIKNLTISNSFVEKVGKCEITEYFRSDSSYYATLNGLTFHNRCEFITCDIESTQGSKFLSETFEGRFVFTDCEFGDNKLKGVFPGVLEVTYSGKEPLTMDIIIKNEDLFPSIFTANGSKIYVTGFCNGNYLLLKGNQRGHFEFNSFYATRVLVDSLCKSEGVTIKTNNFMCPNIIYHRMKLKKKNKEIPINKE